MAQQNFQLEVSHLIQCSLEDMLLLCRAVCAMRLGFGFRVLP
jgi:hypothetical protein